jgi:hypothetical protein
MPTHDPRPPDQAQQRHSAPFRHGQLLVPFPDQMHNASRPEPPPWRPVVAWTGACGLIGIAAGLAGLAFGLSSTVGIGLCVVAVLLALAGIASAGRRANQARRGQNSTARYWVAWGVTLAVLAVVNVAVLAVGVPVYLNHREGLVTKAVESDLKNGGQLKAIGVTATAATCIPAGPRNDAGIRRYDCTLTLDDGRTGSLMVTADADGKWTTVPKK